MNIERKNRDLRADIAAGDLTIERVLYVGEKNGILLEVVDAPEIKEVRLVVHGPTQLADAAVEELEAHVFICDVAEHDIVHTALQGAKRVHRKDFAKAQKTLFHELFVL